MRPKVGDRIRLLSDIKDHPRCIPAGTEGTVDYMPPETQRFQQIGVQWENGSTLMLLPDKDRFMVIS